ncbi:MAG: hypothetical protein IJ315_04765 [Firmicutes bacterium]|nr:hypothetical protein [Bacillota bacterium]
MNFSKKTIMLSLFLAFIGIAYVVKGFIVNDFQWLWIILAFAAAIGNLVAEKYLTTPDDTNQS